jgi:hypothetical protein
MARERDTWPFRLGADIELAWAGVANSLRSGSGTLIFGGAPQAESKTAESRQALNLRGHRSVKKWFFLI